MDARPRPIQTIHYKRRKRKPLKNPSQQAWQNNFLNSGKVCDQSKSASSKILWCLIVFGCSGGCLYQIGVRVGVFLEDAVTLEVELEPQSSFKFPSITLCSMRILNILIYQKNDLVTLGNNQSGAFTQKLWNDIGGINVKNLFLTQECSLTMENCTKPVANAMRIDFVDTVFGRCSILSLNELMEYKGPFTYIDLSWNSSQPSQPKGFAFFVHRGLFHHVHDGILISESALINYNTKFRIYAKELKNLNTRQNPCDSEFVTVKCYNDCVNHYIEEIVNCRLPFLKSTHLKPCETIDEIRDNYELMYPLYFNLSYYRTHCNCKRKCNEMKFALHKDNERKSKNDKTTLRLLYADDTRQTVFEKKMLTASALFSEIGGTVGLYLGISIFAIIDLFESILRRTIFKTF